MEIVLYQPEIAGNVGACIRLSANTNLSLNIIKPLGFNFQENKIRRAGLDYHDLASVSMYEEWDEFKKEINLYMSDLSTHAVRSAINNAKKYDWENTSEELNLLYEELKLR